MPNESDREKPGKLMNKPSNVIHLVSPYFGMKVVFIWRFCDGRVPMYGTSTTKLEEVTCPECNKQIMRLIQAKL